MSKITKALEKAARERLQNIQESVAVAADPVTIRLAESSVREIASAGELHIDPHIVTAAEADSRRPIAEQYRMLRTNLQSLRLRQGSKSIVITSAVNSEGKSVTALNLALSLAWQENFKVILVDADLRKGSIHKWLGLRENTTGLSTALQHNGELNGSLIRLQSPALAVLLSGPSPDRPGELLESSSMKRLLATLKAEFDFVIIDTPPVLPVADPSILAGQVDGVLLVVKAGKTQRKTVLQAQTLLKQTKANLLGCVLTHVEQYLSGYGRYYQYYREASAQDSRKAATPRPQTPGTTSRTYAESSAA